MKQYFFLLILALVGFSLVGWFLWMVLRAIHTVISDWRLGKELDELEAECAERRRLARRAPDGEGRTARGDGAAG